MKVRLDDIHSPCRMCILKGIFYNAGSVWCQHCEYNIAVRLLKRVLKEELCCALCKNSKPLGGGYYECIKGYDQDNSCKNGDNMVIDWELACGEYGLEYDK